jgi:hypothetical protein
MVGPIQPKPVVSATVTAPDAPPQTLAQVTANAAAKQATLTTIQNDAGWALLTDAQKADTLRAFLK